MSFCLKCAKTLFVSPVPVSSFNVIFCLTRASLFVQRDLLSHLCESLRVISQSHWIWTFQFLNNIETLVELSEDIGDQAREESVLGCVLELQHIQQQPQYTHRLVQIRNRLNPNV